MTIKRMVTHAEVSQLAETAAAQIRPGSLVYAIPCGGIPAAYAIRRYVDFELVNDPADADFIVDDLIDTGGTMAKTLLAATRPPTGRKFMSEPPVPVVLIDKRGLVGSDDPWIVWPWESTAEKGIEDHITRLIQFAGDDPTREGLAETPSRVAKAWQFWCKGYGADPAKILKTFEDGAERVDEMVMVRDIPFYTHCEHHMAPFFGTATVAYIPNGRIVGLSKISRLVDCFARRLQVQERLTTQIADALTQHLQPKGVGVILNARHLCMESRGVCQQGHSTISSALRGVFADGTVRQEFLQLAK